MNVSKLIGLWLGLGGVLGLAGFFTLSKTFSKIRAAGGPPGKVRRSILVFVCWAALSLVLFGFTIWIGVELWRGAFHAYKWATVILVLQVPVIALPGVEYALFLGPKLWLVLNLSHPGRVDFEVDFDISPQSSLSFSIRWGQHKPRIFILGANILAVAALLGLGITWPA